MLFLEERGDRTHQRSELALGITTDYTNTEFVWDVIRTSIGDGRLPRAGGMIRANRSPPFGRASDADIN